MPSFIHLFVFSILFPPLFFDGLFERLVLCLPTFSPLIHYFCTTPHTGAVAHYVVQTALFTGFGHVHAGIIRFSASPGS